MLTVDEFFKKYLGKRVEWDNTKNARYQCVDYVKAYIELCYGIKTSSGAAWGNAKDYYLSFPKALQGKFKRIANTPSFVPKKGDIVIWNGTYGHIAVADGVGNTSYFYSYDQNYGSTDELKKVRRVKHSYKNFLGVLRPTSLAEKEETDGKKYKVTATILNVRAGAGKESKVVKRLRKGSTVTVTTISNGWAKIGTNQWVSTDYIKEC